MTLKLVREKSFFWRRKRTNGVTSIQKVFTVGRKMFYKVNLLAIKEGKFGVIWTLGSGDKKKKKVSARLIDKVRIRQMCNDIADLIPVSPKHASLVMVSTLMFGIWRCHQHQVQQLIKDMHQDRRHRKKICLGTIDLPGTVTAQMKNLFRAIENVDEAADENSQPTMTRALAKPDKITLPDVMPFRDGYEDKGFGMLVLSETDDWLQDGGLFEPNQTCIRAGIAPTPQAPRNNHQALIDRDEATGMDLGDNDAWIPQPVIMNIHPGSDPSELTDAMANPDPMPDLDAMANPDPMPDLDAMANPDPMPDLDAVPNPDAIPNVDAMEVDNDLPPFQVLNATGEHLSDELELDQLVEPPMPPSRAREHRRRIKKMKYDLANEMSSAQVRENFATADDLSIKKAYRIPKKATMDLFKRACRTFRTNDLDFELIAGSIIAIEEDVDEPEMSDVRHMTVANSEIRQSVDQDAEITTGGSDTRQQPFEQPDFGVPPDFVDQLDLTDRFSPPQSHSTMRQDETGLQNFNGNAKDEMARFLANIMDNSPTETNFVEVLEQDGPVTRRQAALAFYGLLTLEAEKKIVSEQDQFWGQIFSVSG